MSASSRKLPIALRPGDILAFSGSGWKSDLINFATFGVPRFSVSHIGIVAEYQHEFLLFESTTLSDIPCRIQGVPIKGSQAQRVGPRLARYRGKVWAYKPFRPLYKHESERLTAFLVSGLGRPYDQVGAFRSGGVAFSWLESKIHAPNLASLFCSEWVAAALAEIGLLPTNHPSKWNPNRLIRFLTKKEFFKQPVRLK